VLLVQSGPAENRQSLELTRCKSSSLKTHRQDMTKYRMRCEVASEYDLTSAFVAMHANKVRNAQFTYTHTPHKQIRCYRYRDHRNAKPIGSFCRSLSILSGRLCEVCFRLRCGVYAETPPREQRNAMSNPGTVHRSVPAGIVNMYLIKKGRDVAAA
jgi:hypothetical protein